MATSTQGVRPTTRKWIAAASVVSLALGAVNVVGPFSSEASATPSTVEVTQETDIEIVDEKGPDTEVPDTPGSGPAESSEPSASSESSGSSEPSDSSEPRKSSELAGLSTSGSSFGPSDSRSSSITITARCFGNAVRSPIVWLLPVVLLAQTGGKLIQPYLGQLQGELDGLNQQINARVQEEMRRHEQNNSDDHGVHGRIGERHDRVNEQYGEQFGEIGRRLNEANGQLQGFVNDPMVQKLGQGAGVILALVAAGFVLFDWCSNEVGEAKTSIKGDGSSEDGSSHDNAGEFAQ